MVLWCKYNARLNQQNESGQDGENIGVMVWKEMIFNGLFCCLELRGKARKREKFVIKLNSPVLKINKYKYLQVLNILNYFPV